MEIRLDVYESAERAQTRVGERLDSNHHAGHTETIESVQ
jgi:hypothetical protein